MIDRPAQGRPAQEAAGVSGQFQCVMLSVITVIYRHSQDCLAELGPCMGGLFDCVV